MNSRRAWLFLGSLWQVLAKGVNGENGQVWLRLPAFRNGHVPVCYCRQHRDPETPAKMGSSISAVPTFDGLMCCILRLPESSNPRFGFLRRNNALSLDIIGSTWDLPLVRHLGVIDDIKVHQLPELDHLAIVMAGVLTAVVIPKKWWKQWWSLELADLEDPRVTIGFNTKLLWPGWCLGYHEYHESARPLEI